MTSVGLLCGSLISVSRNFADQAFTSVMALDASQDVIKRVKAVLADLGWISCQGFEDMSDQTRQEVMAKWQVPIDEMNTIIARALIEGPSGDMAVVINEVDHIRICVRSSRMALHEDYGRIKDILLLIESCHAFAYDDLLGYITADPKTMGTGLRASLTMHLPYVDTDRFLSKKSLIVGHHFGGYPSDYYRLENAYTLGVDEHLIIDDLQEMAIIAIRQEYDQRLKVLEADKLSVEDQVFRAVGLVQYAKKVSFEEMIYLLSMLRLGVELDMLPQINSSRIDHLLTHLNIERVFGFKSKSQDPVRQVRYAHMLKGLLAERS